MFTGAVADKKYTGVGRRAPVLCRRKYMQLFAIFFTLQAREDIATFVGVIGLTGPAGTYLCIHFGQSHDFWLFSET